MLRPLSASGQTTLAASKGPVLELERVTRIFGDVVAVRDATVTLRPGEIHAIVGENGAGKSTLLKLAAGVLAPSAGEVRIAGARLSPSTPAEAIARGVGMVHQHFMLVDAFRALENVALGCEPIDRIGRVDWSAVEARARVLQEESGMALPLDAPTAKLTVGERQRLEILRVLYRGARALLLDEPTAVLSPLEADELFATLRRLADDGRTVAVVTHRLDEVARFADHITVMRRGRVVLSRPAAGSASREPADADADGNVASRRVDEAALTSAIMGGTVVPEMRPPPLAEDAALALELEGLSLVDASGVRRLDGVVLAVRAGEVVGVAGVEGNGQRELVRAIAGLEPAVVGAVRVGGARLDNDVRARRRVLGVVHEDRQGDGLVLGATLRENLLVGDHGDLHPGGFDAEGTVRRRIERYGVRPPSPDALVDGLSGGNQQKVVVARALDRLRGVSGARAAVLAQPTRGVDVGAAAELHGAILEAAADGAAVLLVSADLAELRKLCHRIVVLHKGRLAGEFPPDVADDVIGRAMLGLEAA